VSEPATAPSLARHHARLLAAVFILFELLVAGAVVLLLMAPMARRAADDLAGLMLLSAQTWSELPPETQTDFEIELANTHLLMLNQTAEGEVHEEWHGFYLYFLELALEQKTGWMQHLSHSVRDDESWFWATLPSGNGTLAVGFPERRVGTHPLRAMLLTLAAGLVLAILAALGLARKSPARWPGWNRPFRKSDWGKHPSGCRKPARANWPRCRDASTRWRTKCRSF